MPFFQGPLSYFYRILRSDLPDPSLGDEIISPISIYDDIPCPDSVSGQIPRTIIARHENENNEAVCIKAENHGTSRCSTDREGGCSHIRPLCQYLQMNSGFTMLRVSYIRLDHTVRSVFSPIDHTRLIRLRVHEHIKCMSEKLHLHACILGIHRLDLELLRADDRKVILE